MHAPFEVEARAQCLEANKAPRTVYLLRDDLKRLGGMVGPRSGEPHRPLKTFARNLAKRIGGILAQCRCKLNTSILKGMNSNVKVIKRMAYGSPSRSRSEMERTYRSSAPSSYSGRFQR